jgi:hypothetical protein
MLSHSEKFVVDKICFDMLSVFLKINKEQVLESLTIIIKENYTLGHQIVFKNIWIEVNTFLNETSASNIDAAIDEWNSLLPEKLSVVVANSVVEFNKVKDLPEDDIVIKKLLGAKVIYKLVSLIFNAKVASVPGFSKNLQLARSIKFFGLNKQIIISMKSHQDLNLLDLIIFIEENVTKKIDSLKEEFLHKLENGLFEYPKNLDEYF